mgnify:CR=1 FL=1
MVAKGHDFPGVSAVGILSADSLLNLPAYWPGNGPFSFSPRRLAGPAEATCRAASSCRPMHRIITSSSVPLARIIGPFTTKKFNSAKNWLIRPFRK